MKKEEVLAIYGSHDASVTFIDREGKLRVYEYERFVKKRYAMFSSKFDHRADMGTNEESRRSFLTHLKSNLKSDIKLILNLEINDQDKALLKEFFPNAEFKEVGHHYAHACSGYYSSGFESALIISVDGGGWDNGTVSTTNVYLGDGKSITQIECPKIDFGNPYAGIGHLISEISPSPEGRDSIHALSYAGKIMGLCAYGDVNPDWLDSMREYYDGALSLHALCWRIGVPYGYNSLTGKSSYDIAATSQFVFEEKMDILVKDLLNKHIRSVVLVGGCALNVLYNQSLKQLMEVEGLGLYVPPNPNDCGLSYGMFLSMFPEEGYSEICYSGIEILDSNKESELLSNYDKRTYNYEDIIDLLKAGKILGVIDGNSEVGPRALGNRSIICDPSFENMKDTLNAKVKFREWFRPFAPVCRIEDADEYFNQACEAKYMSYAPIVKRSYWEKLKSITHEDGTARLQTVGECDHEFFYGILTKLKEHGHIPVILNTSFNIKGKPILTTLEDALYVLDNTELDYVVTDKYIISKKVCTTL